ncbi:putative PINT domain-containing proteasome regulatory complex component [Cryptosporidium canis]|uniref:PINT domain-containing proteasome regulatory complex component n=1 Tax=Cryptosporidium canis TaxID=195482 RepID=A0A9D5DN20_9CRYT|nr:putative PINT domain-containing proteasome regulatory complex component [Cryptosporidium canis]
MMQLVFTSNGNGRSTSVLLCDWLFTVLDYLDKTRSNSFYKRVCELVREDIQEVDMASIFELLVEGLDGIFEILKEAEAKREIVIREDVKRSFGELYKESEEFFIPLISMLLHPKFDKSRVDLCKKAFLSKIMGWGDIPKLRINILRIYYDIFGEDLELLVDILRYKAKYGCFGSLEGAESSLEMLEKRMARIDGSRSDIKRKLYLTMYEIISSESKDESLTYLNKKAYDYLVGFFGTFKSRDEISQLAKSNGNIVDLGVKFLISSILLPEILFFDTLQSMSIYLYIRENCSDKYKTLLDLFDICCEGTVGDFHDRLQNNNQDYQNLLEKFPVLRTHEANIVNKLQLLTISTLAKGKSSIKLDELEKEFRLSSFDTQDAVVNAISVGLIDGNISENSNAVNINCVTKRQFGRAEWESLDKKLGQWMTHLTTLSSIVANNGGNGGSNNE